MNTKQSILKRIAETKKEEVKQAKHKKSISDLLDVESRPHRDFIAALQDTSVPAIIAEIKRASPSKGLIRKNFNVAEIAKTYETNGARCLSVLTDAPYFQGKPEYLAQARSNSTLPVLRKDFIVDEYQVYESLNIEADCILLIAAILDDKQLQDYCQLAQELNLAVLVESHSREELMRSLRLPTPLIGINNRSLHHFTTDIHNSIELRQWIPEEKMIITESGINSHEDILFMREHNIHRFLIGESLMREQDIAKKLTSLLGNE